MPKEEINLFPPSAQQARRRQLYHKRWAYLGRRLFFGGLVIWFVLGAAGWMAWHQAQVLSAQLRREQSRLIPADEVVRQTNELLGAIHQWTQAHPVWTPLVQDVLWASPEEVRLTVLALQSEGTLMVKGVSSTRAPILTMQRRLEELSWVDAVEAPLQNFAADASGEFSFTLKRKPSYEQP